jgi:hypothetical protein
VRLLDVDDEELGVAAVLLVEPIERGNLPAERRSGVAAEDQHDGALAAERRELHALPPVQGR